MRASERLAVLATPCLAARLAGCASASPVSHGAPGPDEGRLCHVDVSNQSPAYLSIYAYYTDPASPAERFAQPTDVSRPLEDNVIRHDLGVVFSRKTERFTVPADRDGLALRVVVELGDRALFVVWEDGIRRLGPSDEGNRVTVSFDCF